MSRVTHNDYTALVAIMETLVSVDPDMPVKVAWAHASDVQARTRVISATAMSGGLAASKAGPYATLLGLKDFSKESLANWILYSVEASAVEVRGYVADHKKINAINNLRAATMIGLKEAKEAVEFYETLIPVRL